MSQWGAYFRNVRRATTPPRLFTGGRRSKSRAPRRILEVDLRSHSTHLARVRSRALPIARAWWAIIIAGMIVFLILHYVRR